MKIPTEEFISLVQERPALWQKSHPNFSNRDIRIELMTQIAVVAESDVTECSKKLKNLKDSMRAQVAKLPKTSSGLPAFNSSEHITWPFFKRLMFMKNEFSGQKKASSLSSIEASTIGTPDVKSEIITVNTTEPCAYLSAPTGSQIETSPSPSVQSWDSFEDSLSVKKPKRHRPTRSLYDYDERKLVMLERVVKTDELDVFASDIANDLRKIKSPLKLLQAKSQIRRIAEEFAMNELLLSAHDTDLGTALSQHQLPSS